MPREFSLQIDYICLHSRLYNNYFVKCKTYFTNEFEASCSWLKNQQLLKKRTFSVARYFKILFYCSLWCRNNSAESTHEPEDQLMCMFTLCCSVSYLLLLVKFERVNCKYFPRRGKNSPYVAFNENNSIFSLYSRNILHRMNLNSDVGVLYMYICIYV